VIALVATIASLYAGASVIAALLLGRAIRLADSKTSRPGVEGKSLPAGSASPGRISA